MANPTSRSGRLSGRWLGYAVLALFAIISLGPIWIAVKTAVSDSRTLFTGASSFLPQDPTLFNFDRVMGLVNPSDPRLEQTSFGKIDFYRALMNSVIFTVLAVRSEEHTSELQSHSDLV